MAVRMTKTGLQSYDPMGSFKKKKKTDLAPTNTQTTAKPTLPTTNPISQEENNRISEGNAYIRQREKLSATQGLTQAEAARKLIPQEEAVYKGKQAEKEQAEIANLPSSNLPSNEEIQKGLAAGEPQNTPEELLNMFKAGKISRQEYSAQVRKQAPKFKQSAAETYDIVGRILSPLNPFGGNFLGKIRESAIQIQAVESFNSARAILEKDIEDVKYGLPYARAQKDFEEAYSAINRLESYNKKTSALDPTYWRDNGAAINLKIENEKSILQNLRLELDAAIRTQQIAQINTQYGVE